MSLFFGYRFAEGARISALALIAPRRLSMGRNSFIAGLTVAINLDEVILGDHAIIGRSNWITGYPKSDPRHFAREAERVPRLVLGDHSSVTKNHHLDCTNGITIGRFTTIAGYRSQILTHSINLRDCRQESRPVEIGDYCFVGTNCVILPGAVLPDSSVLGALSLLRDRFDDQQTLYSGAPAAAVKKIATDYRYFSREVGAVD